MKIKEGTRVQTVETLEFEGLTVDKWELMELLEELNGTDCFMSAVTIHDSPLRAKLEKLKIIHTNIRGSSCPGEKYPDFYAQIYEICYEESNPE